MRVYRPVFSNKITQPFGANLACAKTDVSGRMRIPSTVVGKRNGTCPIGFKEFYPLIGMKGHNGYDLATWHGEPLYFNVDANTEWWSRSEIDLDGGIGVDIFSTKRVKLDTLPPESGKMARREFETNDGYVYVKFRYWHLKSVYKPDAKKGEGDFHPVPNVKLGDLIGFCDNTGASSGDHVHFGFKIVFKNSMTMDNDNGYYGALDPTPYYVNEFIVKALKDVKVEALTAIQKARQIIFMVKTFLGLI